MAEAEEVMDPVGVIVGGLEGDTVGTGVGAAVPEGVGEGVGGTSNSNNDEDPISNWMFWNELDELLIVKHASSVP